MQPPVHPPPFLVGAWLKSCGDKAVSGARANNGSGQGVKGGRNIHSILGQSVFLVCRLIASSVGILPGSVDQLLPVSRQKSSNFPYLDMAGFSVAQPLALNGLLQQQQQRSSSFVLQSGAQAASGVDSPDRAKVARVNCGGVVRVVRDDVLLVAGPRWLVLGTETCSREPRWVVDQVRDTGRCNTT